ncbi:alpha/beta fold hydrolase [Deinococcus ruber]|uniref:Alpha/beta hydrolase n=1 Tax=Deinococcus ruber TaxID=1848197 RepID=A0A918F4D0_9DEIO|nr:alpha/beta hydrolase [Deinococcus ruber]GGR07535.1 alpha/beta hydrolase [Deinococcus ruber]
MTTSELQLASGDSFTLTEDGSGRPVLILHGGGGPSTVAGIAQHLATTRHTLLPTHPGWNGTARPAHLSTIGSLAAMYLDFLNERDLHDVLVIGSSIGGWLACELALQDTSGRISKLILIDAVGIEVPGEPIRDFFALDARGVAEFSFHDAARFYTDPATVPPEQMARQRTNMETMRVLAADPYMHDPALLARLATLQVPVLVIWGDSDRIVTPAYGAAFAAALPGARFQIVERAGHLPQIEQPAATFALIDEFALA